MEPAHSALEQAALPCYYERTGAGFMKKKEKVAVLKSILLALGDTSAYFQIESDLAFVKPIGNCYRGIFIEDSRWDKDVFYVEIFFCPLHRPSDLVYFNNGGRIRRGNSLVGYDAWKKENIEDIAAIVKKDVLSALLYSYTDEKVLSLLNKTKKDSTSLITLEARILLAARISDMKTLQSAYKVMMQNLYIDRFSWHKGIFERIETIMQNRHDIRFIKDLTDKWKDETAKSLKLEPYLQDESKT